MRHAKQKEVHAMKKGDSKQGKCVWVVLSVLFWLSSIHYSSAAETGAVRLGLPLQVSSSMFIVAAEQGYFAQEGLKITVKNYGSGNQALNDGLFTGEVDVIATAEVPVVFSSFTRNDFNILASIGTMDGYTMIVARTKSGIRKPADLKGKRIATQKGSAVHFFLHLFLLKHHLSEKDIKLTFMKIEELPEALARGEIDAFSSTDLSFGEAKAKLGSDGIAVFEDDNLYSYMMVLVVSKKFVRENPDAAKSILKAVIKAEEFIRKQPEEAKKILSKRLNMPITEIADSWGKSNFTVQLPQSLIIAMEDEARWVRDSKLVQAKTLPNYLDFIHIDALKSVRPRSVGIIR
jgi:sulfonate transport system substrate-binding protein